MKDWLLTLKKRLAVEAEVMRVVIVAVAGSTPREVGTCLLTSGRSTSGTIGGGHLEFKAIAVAHDMLARTEPVRLDRYTLGATLGQCCGGALELWFERYTHADLAMIDEALRRREQGALFLRTLLDTNKPLSRSLVMQAHTLGFDRASGIYVEALKPHTTALYLFGAGHVARALVRVLIDLPISITWIDNRENMFPTEFSEILASDEHHLAQHYCDAPADEVKHAPPGCHYLIMTHHHDLDFDICRAVLRRPDIGSLGMIGSATKAARFRRRLDAMGSAADRLICPIGLADLPDKQPAAIAISVAAQLLQHIAAAQAVAPLRARA